MLEDIFVKAINSIKATVGPSATVNQGAAAIASGSNKPARGYVTDRILQGGDVVSVPSMDATKPDDLERWLDAPAVKDGEPVLHCLARVQRASVTLPMPIFIGNFVKEVTAVDGTVHRNTVLDRAGNAIDLTSTCADIGEQWRLLAGRTFRIDTVTPIKTMRRNRKTMVAYEGTANIYTIREV